ncbi:hypothetical protein K1T71_012035 [Dendrolimus kikuchii]|uniref:Uncharacterized protein n=1 Tax=Dendrolimus kikuchii TaxID=765133 RepID=A0ACC1CKP3_9NEOP|nr:hypothetical protein K1T71_012035 [Dendrolimus kikuchii]
MIAENTLCQDNKFPISKYRKSAPAHFNRLFYNFAGCPAAHTLSLAQRNRDRRSVSFFSEQAQS